MSNGEYHSSVGSGVGPRRPARRWSEADKRRIVAESYEPGVTVAAVARRNVLGVGIGRHAGHRRRCRSVIPLVPPRHVGNRAGRIDGLHRRLTQELGYQRVRRDRLFRFLWEHGAGLCQEMEEASDPIDILPRKATAAAIASAPAAVDGEIGNDPGIDCIQGDIGTVQPNRKMASGSAIAIHREIGVAEAVQMGDKGLDEGRELARLHEIAPARPIQNWMWHDYPPVLSMHPGEDCSHAELLRLREDLTRCWMYVFCQTSPPTRHNGALDIIPEVNGLGCNRVRIRFDGKIMPMRSTQRRSPRSGKPAWRRGGVQTERHPVLDHFQAVAARRRNPTLILVPISPTSRKRLSPGNACTASSMTRCSLPAVLPGFCGSGTRWPTRRDATASCCWFIQAPEIRRFTTSTASMRKSCRRPSLATLLPQPLSRTGISPRPKRRWPDSSNRTESRQTVRQERPGAGARGTTQRTRLADGLGLTSAESRIAARLAQDRTIDDTAAGTRGSGNAVMRHMGCIHEKHDFARYAELVQLAMSLAGLPGMRR